MRYYGRLVFNRTIAKVEKSKMFDNHWLAERVPASFVTKPIHNSQGFCLLRFSVFFGKSNSPLPSLSNLSSRRSPSILLEVEQI